VSELVKWMVSGGAESDLQATLFIIGYLFRRLRARLLGEPQEEEGEHVKAADGADDADDAQRSSGAPSASDGAAARSDALVKRLYSVAGLLGVYVTWAIMAWFIFTYGMLIYKQLGANAQAEFAKARATQRARLPAH
jgi:hypothetical protein